MRYKILPIVLIIMLCAGSVYADACNTNETEYDDVIGMNDPAAQTEAIQIVKEELENNLRLDWELINISVGEKTSEGFYRVEVTVTGGAQFIKGTILVKNGEIKHNMMNPRSAWDKKYYKYQSVLLPAKKPVVEGKKEDN